jgi:hypothetical protein
MSERTEGEVLFPRWLIIVRRDESTLYEHLVMAFRFNERIDVLVDRRQASPHGSPQPIRSERRSRLTARERALWQHVGFRVIYIAGGAAAAAAARARSAGSQVGETPATPS